MKKKLLIMLIALWLLTWIYFLVQYLLVGRYFTIDKMNENFERYMPWVGFGTEPLPKEYFKSMLEHSFHHRWYKLYYWDIYLSGASAIWFRSRDSFGIDKDGNFWHQSNIVSWVDGNSLQFFPENYSYVKDKDWIYTLNGTHSKKISIINPETFIPLADLFHNFYAKDDEHVYLMWEIITGAAPQDLSFFDRSMYFRSNWKIFWYKQVVTWAHVDTFQVFFGMSGIGYWVDQYREYYRGKPITKDFPTAYERETIELSRLSRKFSEELNFQLDDMRNFNIAQNRYLPRQTMSDLYNNDPDKQHLRGRYSEDGEFVYYQDTVVSGANPERFLPIWAFFAVDLKDMSVQVDKLYWHDKEIMNVDKDSFFFYGKWTLEYAWDKHHIFWSGSILTGADRKSFEVIAELQSDGEEKLYNSFAKDKNHLYYKWESYDLPDFDIPGGIAKDSVFWDKLLEHVGS